MNLFKKYQPPLRREHDPLCMGDVSWPHCDCEIISQIREDDREHHQQSLVTEAFEMGYNKGRTDAAKALKKHLKHLKKSARKEAIRAARGDLR